MADEYRKAIALDFDGVLHSYTSGWKGIDVIPDPPVIGAIGWLTGICMYSAWDVIITSCRCNEEKGRDAMHNWLYDQVRNHMSPASRYQCDDGEEKMADDHATVMASIEFAVEKPTRAFIFIDDRGWKFNGTFPSLTELEYFKPWYK